MTKIEAQTNADTAICTSDRGVRQLRILIADADSAARKEVVSYLDNHGLQGVAASPPEIFRYLSESEPDLIILDPYQGYEDDLDLLRLIRQRCNAPLIITTGHRRDEIDRIVGLELGADDYLIKPYGLGELLARIRALLRRCRPCGTVRTWDPDPTAQFDGLLSGQRGELQRAPDHRQYRFGGWLLDPDTRRLTNRAKRLVPLTKSEYALLVAFLNHPQRPLSREELLQMTCGHEAVSDRTIDVQILRLRRKLEADISVPRIIRTERGIGYMFVLAVELL